MDKTYDPREADKLCQRSHREWWRVVQRNCNYSAFNGYRRTWSAYSGLRCISCGRWWRTNAGYVVKVPTIKQGEWPRVS